MVCASFERRIVEYLENQLAPSSRSVVEAHLAGCERCKRWAEALADIDGLLTRAARRPVLSPDFCARLQRRIESESVVVSEADLVERQRALQAEFDSRLLELRRRSFRAPVLVESIGSVLLALMGAWLFSRPLLAGLQGVKLWGWSEFAQLLALSSAASVVFLLVGFAVAFQNSHLYSGQDT